MKRYILFLFIVLLYGGLYAEESFKEVLLGRIFTLDQQGNMYVDSGEHSIAKYSPKGEFLLKMGQKGEGPGDIKRLGWFEINPLDNVIYVTEFLNGNKWVSRFSTGGKYLGEWKCTLDWQKYGAITCIQFDGEGNIYIQKVNPRSYRLKEFTVDSFDYQLLKYSPEGQLLKTIYTLSYDFSASKGGKGEVTIPFGNYLFWNIHKDNVIVRENTADYITIFDLDGNLKKKVPLPFKKEKVTKKDRDEWVEEMKSNDWVKKAIARGTYDLKYWRERLPFPEYKPVSGGSMFIDNQDNLYSRPYSQVEGAKYTTWAKINLDTYTLTLAYSPRRGGGLIKICTDFNYIFKRDAEGNAVLYKTDGDYFSSKGDWHAGE